MSRNRGAGEMRHIGLFSYRPESHFLSPVPSAPTVNLEKTLLWGHAGKPSGQAEISLTLPTAASRNKTSVTYFFRVSSLQLHCHRHCTDVAARIPSLLEGHKQTLMPSQCALCWFTISPAFRKASSSWGSDFLTCIMTCSFQILFERVIGTVFSPTPISTTLLTPFIYLAAVSEFPRIPS